MPADPGSSGLALTTLLSSTEFWSAVFGAVVGGAIALIGQLLTIWQANAARREDALRGQQALGAALTLKAIRIQSNIFAIYEHFNGCMGRVSEDGTFAEPWQFYSPIANPASKIEFSFDEIGAVFRLKNDEVFNRILSMDISYNSLVASLQILDERRSHLNEKLSYFNVSTSENVVTAHIAADEMLSVRPIMIDINTLFSGVVDMLIRQLIDSKLTVLGLTETLNAKLKLGMVTKPNTKLDARINELVAEMANSRPVG